MNKNKVVIAVIFALLAVYGWVNLLSSNSGSREEINLHVQNAQEYRQKGLYQKAMQECEAVLQQSENPEIRAFWVELNQLAYEDEVLSLDDYIDNMIDACVASPDTEDYWVKAFELSLDNREYGAAHAVYKQYMKVKISTPKLTELADRAAYCYKTNFAIYEEVYQTPYGMFTVNSGAGWGTLDSNAKNVYDCDYDYVGMLNQKGEAIYTTQRDTRLIDKKGIVQAINTVPPIKAGAYGDGLIPIQQENGTWRYLNAEDGEWSGNSYWMASNYQNKISAVQVKEGWYLVDENGFTICQTAFEDIKLYPNGDYQYKNVMVAKENGVYSLYDQKGSRLVQEMGYADMDVYMGGDIAFQDNSGRWGFVDKKGNVTIEPQFAAAKSFSNGLAAVNDGELWGFCNAAGRVVIGCSFLDAGYFTSDGTCFVSELDKQYYAITLRYPGG